MSEDAVTIVRVARDNVCVGCGACCVATREITMRSNEFGYFQVDLSRARAETLALASTVCPFADEAVDEDTIARQVFPQGLEYERTVGHYLSIYVGRVCQGEDVTESSSGGLTTWVTLEMLKRGLIDGVIHVGATSDKARGLFEYCISHTPEEVRRRRKSQYYSTNIASALQSIKGNAKRYAFVGVPCFVKAVRLLSRHDAQLQKQLAFCIGIVCGHLKSSGFAELLSWQLGVHPADLARVDFRVKDPSRAANEYGFSAWSDGTSEPVTHHSNSLVGGNWGHAMFQLKACDYCDDIFAETADIVFGDAWLPQYQSDWRGTNVIVNRSPRLERILRDGSSTGAIWIQPLSVSDAAASQAGNYRHRWDGLSVRLVDDRAAGRWSPRKRIGPGSRKVRKALARLIRLRRQLSELSHHAFRDAKAAGSLEHYFDIVRPAMDAIDAEYAAQRRGPLLWRFARKLARHLGVRRRRAH